MGQCGPKLFHENVLAKCKNQNSVVAQLDRTTVAPYTPRKRPGIGFRVYAIRCVDLNAISSGEGYVNSWFNLHLAQAVASETTRRFSTAEATLMLANKR